MLKSSKKFIFIAGPCVIEDKKKTLEIAKRLKGMLSKYPFHFIFKASFDKANRTSVKSFRGPGLTKGIKILEEIKHKLKVPVLSDVHCTSQIDDLASVLDVIQIPAFLCRQTDLIVEAARTGKTINIKKGQFLAPHDVKHIIDKVKSSGNKKILLTERGVSFGYNNLVVDFRSFGIMQQWGYPVIYDVTHSLQRPSAASGISGGDSAFVPAMAKAAVAYGVNGLFMEVHPSPKKALSDKHTSFALDKLTGLLKQIVKIRKVINEKN